jgi:hypothetical protein
MADEEKKRRFNMSGGPPKLIDGGVMGQMLGGIGTGLGAGLAGKMNDRLTLAAAALNGLLSDPNYTDEPSDAAEKAQQYADALLKRLEEVPDPRYPEPETESKPGP